MSMNMAQKIMISTHALTWSATFHLWRDFRIWTISTHALTWSATAYCKAVEDLGEFQLTHSRGVRL